ncbi:hypothetical protein LUZ63_002602 [Rhynchospora breviuscula]|uniref:DUF8039 domain-containing protein n=1 Tax=Rhynchospora breviuscula TaxID=2022672 RepID=A0A9Q0HZ30_9POAL|nr:hypothetical protein LUZ63_002602 [Rhynchospora breviuscula]
MSNPDENFPSNVDDDHEFNEDEDLMANQETQPVSRRGKRSTAKCLKTAKKIAAQVPLEITFNEKDQPSGENAIEFNRFLAQKTRDMVKISYKTWPSVPKELKLDLYNTIAKTWNIPDDIPNLIKRKILTACCNRWRAWKTNLNKKYRENAKEGGQKPWDVFNISQEEWEQFDEYHKSLEFEKKSKIGKENAAKKGMPHTLGSGGYISAEKTWKKDDVVHGSTSTITISVDDRSYRWCRARATEDPVTGELRVTNPKACEVLDKAVALAKSGEIQSIRQNDVLTSALGTPEHSGRLRGYPIFSGVKQVFGKGTRKSKQFSQEEIDKRVDEGIKRRLPEEVSKEVSKEVARQVEESLSQLFSLGQTPHNADPVMNQGILQSFSRLFAQGQTSHNLDPIMNQAMILLSQGSNNQPNPIPGPHIEGSTEALLLLPDGFNLVYVARAMVFARCPVPDTVHGVPLGPEEVKVQVLEVFDHAKQVTVHFPPPNADDQLGILQGSFLRWPRNLVDFDMSKLENLRTPITKQPPPPAKSPEKKKGKQQVQQNDDDDDFDADAFFAEGGQLKTREPLCTHERLQKLGPNAQELHNYIMALDPDMKYFDIPAKFDHIVLDSFMLNFEDIGHLFNRELPFVQVMKLWTM